MLSLSNLSELQLAQHLFDHASKLGKGLMEVARRTRTLTAPDMVRTWISRILEHYTSPSTNPENCCDNQPSVEEVGSAITQIADAAYAQEVVRRQAEKEKTRAGQSTFIITTSLDADPADKR